MLLITFKYLKNFKLKKFLVFLFVCLILFLITIQLNSIFLFTLNCFELIGLSAIYTSNFSVIFYIFMFYQNGGAAENPTVRVKNIFTYFKVCLAKDLMVFQISICEWFFTIIQNFYFEFIICSKNYQKAVKRRVNNEEFFYTTVMRLLDIEISTTKKRTK